MMIMVTLYPSMKPSKTKKNAKSHITTKWSTDTFAAAETKTKWKTSSY